MLAAFSAMRVSPFSSSSASVLLVLVLVVVLGRSE